MGDDNLIDISGIVIDCTVDKSQRVKKFVETVVNPYAFKVGDVEVAISFNPKGGKLQDKMEDYFAGLII
ncbi:MAG: hypothetical protein RR791_05585 [Lachnospiraceae bacterium]